MVSFLILLFCLYAINVWSSSSESDQSYLQLRKLIEQQNEQIRTLVIKMEVQGNDIDRLNSEVKSLQSKVLDQDRVIYSMKIGKNRENVPTESDVGNPSIRKDQEDIQFMDEQKSVLIKDRDNPESGVNHSKPIIAKRLLLPTQPDQQTIAFYAYLSLTEVDPGHHHTILFDDVVTNVGNGYNKHGGTFIAPMTGVYAFSYSVSTEFGGRIPVEIVVNSQVMCASAADSKQESHIATTSATMIVYMNQGDTCLLRISSNKHNDIVGNIYSSQWSRSSFAGWKI